MSLPIIIGIDGSLTAYGIGCIEIQPSGALVPLSAYCCITRPDPRSRHMYAADQDGQRVDQIATMLLAVLDDMMGRTNKMLVAIEAPAGSRGAKAAKALGLAYGISRTAVLARNGTMITLQASESKLLVGGSRDASKEAVAAGVREMIGWTSMGGTKPAREGQYDAMANAITGARSPMAQMMRTT